MVKKNINITELGQLSRFLFDSAANKFYISVAIELLAGFTGVIANFIDFNDQIKLIVAIVGFIIFAVAYFLRLQFDSEYDRAETMRRQSVLSEALGWDLSRVQFSKWRQKAGKKLLSRLKREIRPNDYYETTAKIGPRKLLEMTQESAFYTRCLYSKIHGILGFCLLLSFSLLFLVFSIIFPVKLISTSTEMVITYSIYLILPLMLSTDILSWFLKLSRIKSEIFNIEESLERLDKQKNIKESEIMRLVSEYNCQLIGALPIPNRLFCIWHDEIKELWKNSWLN
jgi:hypothetical protein